MQDNPNPILQQSDETVQSAVYNWFKYRYIGFSNADKFKDILQRNVAINYPIYKQKLRIEPGVSQYDWLVSVYRERQYKTRGNGTQTRTHGADVSTTETEGHGLTSHRTEGNSSNVKTGGITSTKGGNVKTEYDTTDTHTKSGYDTTADTGTDTHVKTGTDTTKDTGTDTHAKTGTESTEGTKNSSSTHSGGYTEEDVEGLHTEDTRTVAGKHTTTESPHVQTVTVEDSGHGEHSGDAQVTGALPMSESYTTFTSAPASFTVGDGQVGTDPQQEAAAKAGMPTQLNWSTVSGQSQGTHNGYANDSRKQTTSYVYDGNAGNITETEGDSTNPDTEKKTRQGDSASPDTKTVTYNDEKTVVDETSNDTVTYDTEDTDTKNLTHATTYNVSDKDTKDLQTRSDYHSSDTDTKTGADTTIYDTVDSTTYNSVTDTGTQSMRGEDEDNTTESVTNTSNYGTIQDISDDNRTDREQVTGRNEAPAELLARATAFIEKSSAFMWFKEQIDCCFSPMYYTEEDDDGNSYGSAFI